MMLQFLQSGKVLYVLAVMCGAGVLSKLVTSSLYKRLIKETGNMALTKNKNLRIWKQKTENMLLLSHGIRNTNAYIEKQLYEFRFMRLSLDTWDNLSVQAMILCFLIGGIAAFASYWYRSDSYFIVLYGTMGILSGLSMVLVDSSFNTSVKRQQLVDCLTDYVDNSPRFFRNADKQEEARSIHQDMAEHRNPIPQGNGKISLLSRRKGRKEPAVSCSWKRNPESAAVKAQEISERARKGEALPEEDLKKSIDGLKQSLQQIAASREQVKSDLQTISPTPQENGRSEGGKKELSPDDIRLLGEFLQKYLT